MGRRHARAALPAFLVLVLATGCAPTPTPLEPPVAGLAAAVQPVWRLEVRLVGDSVVRAGVVASYVRGGRTGLQVRAWSLADGHELWRHDAHIGRAPAGEPLSLAAVRVGADELVAFLSPTTIGTPSELVVAGLASGRPRSIRRPVADATSRIDACGHDICFEGWSLDTRRLREPAKPLRVDVDAGRIRRDPDEAPAGGFEIGDHLFAVEAGGAQQIVSTATGASWRRPYAGVFGAGSTTAGGWEWHRIAGVRLGVGGRAGVIRDHRYVSDLAAPSTVALDPTTGATRWRLRAVSPCPGAALADSVGGGLVELCRVHGSASAPDHDATPASVTYRDVAMTRVGVDARTGRIVWSRPVPESASAVRATTPTIVRAGRWDAIRERGRTLLLDRRTGRSTAAPKGSSFLCRTARDPVTAEREHEADGGDSLDPCIGATVTRGALEHSAIDGGNGWWVAPGARTLSVYSLGR